MTAQPTAPVQSQVSLVIPCHPQYVPLCRLVAGAIGSRDGLPEDLVADLKVVATEACNCLLAFKGGAPEHPGAAGAGLAKPAGSDCTIHMEFDSGAGEFAVSALFPGPARLMPWLEGCDPMSEAGLGFTILKALTDEIAESDAGADGTMLRLIKRFPAAC
jgi:hypothetical protein